MQTKIEALLARANVYRYAAQTAPTPRQAQAANRLADEQIRKAKEGTLPTAIRDAALIVTPVNAHNDLIAAAELALHKIEQTLDGQYTDGAALRAALDPLRAALAKAHADG